MNDPTVSFSDDVNATVSLCTFDLAASRRQKVWRLIRPQMSSKSRDMLMHKRYPSLARLAPNEAYINPKIWSRLLLCRLFMFKSHFMQPISRRPKIISWICLKTIWSSYELQDQDRIFPCSKKFDYVEIECSKRNVCASHIFRRDDLMLSPRDIIMIRHQNNHLSALISCCSRFFNIVRSIIN